MEVSPEDRVSLLPTLWEYSVCPWGMGVVAVHPSSLSSGPLNNKLPCLKKKKKKSVLKTVLSMFLTNNCAWIPPKIKSFLFLPLALYPILLPGHSQNGIHLKSKCYLFETKSSFLA